MRKKILVFVLVLSAVFSLTGCSFLDYQKANFAFDRGDYAAAGEIFQSLDGYLDSADRFRECVYQLALSDLNNKQFENAIAVFQALGSYRDSADKLRECGYQLALDRLYSKNYQSAIAGFEALGDYKDSMLQLETATDCLIRERLVGSWSCDAMDYSGVMTASVLSGMQGLGTLNKEECSAFYPGSECVLRGLAAFDEYGNFSVTLTEEDCQRALRDLDATLHPVFSDLMAAVVKKQVEEQGSSIEELESYYGIYNMEDLIAKLYNMDLDAMYNSVFPSIFSKGIGSLSSNGTYTVEGGMILLRTSAGNEVARLDLTEDTLCFTGDGVRLGESNEPLRSSVLNAYPQTFTRR